MPLGTLARDSTAVEAVRFDRFIVHIGQRLLLADGQPLRLGGRALDILLVLLEHAGNVVDKHTLLARVWPDSVVEDINLRVHIAALRRALGEGFIINLPGQGYRFAAPVLPAEHAAVLAPDVPTGNLPTRLSGIVLSRPPAHPRRRHHVLACTPIHPAHVTIYARFGISGR